MAVVWLLALVGAAMGAMRLEVDTSTNSVLDKQGDAWSFYQASLETFGSDEMVVVALEGARPYDPLVLRQVATLSRELEQIDGVKRVDSLATVPVVRLDDTGNLLLTPAVDGVSERFDANRAEAVAALVERDRIAPRSLISADGRVAALNVILNDAGRRDVERIVADVKAMSPAESWISGVPIFRTEINTRTGSEIAFFAVLTVAVVSALYFAAFGSINAVIQALSLGLVGTLTVAGAMGWLGVPLTLSTMILPSIMLALGCAYAMHAVAAVMRPSGRHDVEAALVEIAEPLAISSLTTAIGFVAISATRIEALREVGGFGALGVLSLSLASLTLTPALLSWLPVHGESSRGAVARLERVGTALSSMALRITERRSGSVLLLGTAFACVMAIGLGSLTIETDATRWFKRGTRVRDDYEQIRSRLSGISPMNVVVSVDAGGVTAPATLGAIDGLASHLESLSEVGKAVSVADPLRQLHGEFSAESGQPLPTSKQVAEQYLLLLGSMDRIGDLLTPDRANANVLLRVDNNGSDHLLGVANAAASWWGEHGPAGSAARATGIMYEFARAQEEISVGQLRGLAFAFSCVGLILLLSYRSLSVAALALVPNVIPIIAAYGAMGLLDVPLDAGTVLVGSMALGIAVDDTVHVVDGFWRYGGPAGSTARALRAAFNRSMIPMALTTVVVGAGFCVLGLSDFTFTRNLGILTAAILLLCFVTDVLLLPALLFSRARMRGGR